MPTSKDANLQDAQLGKATLTNTDLRGANVHHAYLGIPHIDLVDLSTTRRAHRAGVPVLSHLWRLVQTQTRPSDPRGRRAGRAGDTALSTVNPQAATPAPGTTLARPSATPDAVEPGAAGAPVLPTARGAALAGPADPSPPPVPASDAEMRRVSDLLHAQADRVLEDAAQLSHRADETRAAATDQDAQADELYGRAARLHFQADQVCADR